MGARRTDICSCAVAMAGPQTPSHCAALSQSSAPADHGRWGLRAEPLPWARVCQALAKPPVSLGDPYQMHGDKSEAQTQHSCIPELLL